eukprot:TRINITY_DN912_c0_g1_i8.p1 TRINITY_DN912_c0_g1~~TRINITY_DN912_c0_g1_i8.p1  ORF type:complete len:663 (+),score=274.56 TRINITY_DN912_c0_g1_i8:2545-4533(+)
MKLISVTLFRQLRSKFGFLLSRHRLFGKKTMPGKKKSKLGSQLTKQRNRDKLHTRNALRNDANGIWVNQEYEKKSAPVSILETNALEEFLNNAILAEKDFTAHKRNAQIVDSGFGVTGDLMDYLQGSNQDKRMQTEEELAHMLRIPRRPKWTESTTAEELEGLERTEFLEWRRSLAGLERNDAIAMSPFEKNLDVWRQLWRVIERSDVVVQIVDARNPLVYRCEDLELYIEEVGATQGREKKLLLLLNKADLISKKNRRKWARYFRKQGIEFMFWSANYEKMELEEKAKEMERLAEETEEYDRLEKMIMDNDLLMMSDQMGEVGASSTSAALAEEDEEEEEGTGDVGNAFGLLSALADEEEETGKGKLVDEEWGKDNNDTEFLFEVTKDSVDDDEGEEEDEQVEETEEGVEEEDTKEALEQVNVENELGEGKLGDDGEEQEEEEVVIDLDSLSDVHIYTRLELLAFFERMTQDIVQEKRAEEEEWWKSTHKEGDSEEDRAPVRAVVGMVGYPNVGKSSTINVLCHEKKVTVSATPGKTKHFQTHVLTDDLMLCDCPGLVFPSFMANKAEMIVAGVLPIDQMREHYSPVTLLCHRISRYTMERLYGIVFPEPTEDEDPSRPPTARELLQAYATVRGYMSNKGVPDESRAARDVLKDYINGVLL